jgi:hypothetical protein
MVPLGVILHQQVGKLDLAHRPARHQIHDPRRLDFDGALEIIADLARGYETGLVIDLLNIHIR